jgi:hypothetical protein
MLFIKKTITTTFNHYSDHLILTFHLRHPSVPLHREYYFGMQIEGWPKSAPKIHFKMGLKKGLKVHKTLVNRGFNEQGRKWITWENARNLGPKNPYK